MDWDQYFMTMCYLVAMRSKDERTWVGSVIVGPDNEIRSTGYNSLPRGMDDSIKARFEKPAKEFLVEHAERNGIYNAARMGIDIKGCKLYVNKHICSQCARGAQQSGISEVIIHEAFPGNCCEHDEDIFYARMILDEGGVKLRYWNGQILQIQGRAKGDDIQF